MTHRVFATLFQAGNAWKEVDLWVQSLRRFGGEDSRAPVLCGVPAGEVPPWSIEGVEIIEVPIPSAVQKFPFGTKVAIAAALEAVAAHQCADTMIWMDPDTLILREPAALHLLPGQILAARPVHHRLIASLASEPLDTFWQTVYAGCGAVDHQAFVTQTIVDALAVRAYWNAGLLVADVSSGLFHAWWENFRTMIVQPEYLPFFEQHPLYRIFFHQAVLAATILAQLTPDQVTLLPDSYNYPLHLLPKMPQDRRITHLEDCHTVRYDEYSPAPAWLTPEFVGEPWWQWFQSNWPALISV